ncbi:MAG: outer-membrane lipoprotein carrier protein LolA [Spirochaetales bacterium]|nr:outer-membrane lipoprotein carrier protein LolA [Spirochaetales bacterium]MCF7938205.1 outer-membrane lipoprotein carrier protein LolA [Spirochaetales bacterium]
MTAEKACFSSLLTKRDPPGIVKTITGVTKEKILKASLRFIPIIVLFVLAVAPVVAQEGQDIQTAVDYFDRVSERYGRIVDYTARVVITEDEETMTGRLFYKSPHMLRINFEQPEEQVLVSNGETLQVYIPQYQVVMTQSLKRRSDAAISSMADKQGLELLKKNYSIAYLHGPEPEPLDEENGEEVVKLRLTWRSSNVGFRQLDISVNQDLLIRRIKGVTSRYDTVQMDYLEIETNQNIPDARFDYEADSSANVFDNFLYESE